MNRSNKSFVTRKGLHFIGVLLMSLSVVGCNADKKQTLNIKAPVQIEQGTEFVASVEALNSLEASDKISLSTDQPHVLIAQINDTEFLVTVPLKTELTKLVLNARSAAAEGTVTIYAATPYVNAPTSKVTPYPLVHAGISSFEKLPHDENNIPLFTNADGSTEPFHIQISKIAQHYYARIYGNHHTPQEYDRFIAMSDWLVENCIESEDYGFCSWQSQLDVPYYQLPDMWPSAMAQGQGISVLISAYSLTFDHIYLDTAIKAIPAFNYSIDKKGVRSDYQGVPWYEEYGSEVAPVQVLNGFLFALAGLHQAADQMGSQAARNAFETGVKSLAARIQRFDVGFTSRYDDPDSGQLASTKGAVGDHYHELHISQLSWLYAVTNNEVFFEYARKFLLYDTAGLHSLPSESIYQKSKKILAVSASSTINSLTHGVEYLTDSNWTWKRYWSSNKPNTTLHLTLNDYQVPEQGFQLNALRFTGVLETDIPESFDLYSCENSERVLVTAGVNTAESTTTSFPYEVGGYPSFTKVINLNRLVLPCPNLEISMNMDSRSNILRLREINVHMEQPAVLSEIIDSYRGD